MDDGRSTTVNQQLTIGAVGPCITCPQLCNFAKMKLFQYNSSLPSFVLCFRITLELPLSYVSMSLVPKLAPRAPFFNSSLNFSLSFHHALFYSVHAPNFFMPTHSSHSHKVPYHMPLLYLVRTFLVSTITHLEILLPLHHSYHSTVSPSPPCQSHHRHPHSTTSLL